MLRVKFLKKQKRQFLPPLFNPMSRIQVLRILKKLLKQEPRDFYDSYQWFGLFHELSCAVAEAHARLQAKVLLNTNNETLRRNIDRFETKVLSCLLEGRVALTQIYLNSPWQKGMHADDYGRLKKTLSFRSKHFSPQLSELQVEESKVSRGYQDIIQKTKVTFQNRSVNLSFLPSYFFHRDEKTRQEAYTIYFERLKNIENDLQDVFDNLFTIRQKQANVARENSYQEFSFHELGRYDYKLEDYRKLRTLIKKYIVPLYTKSLLQDKKNYSERKMLPIWETRPSPALIPEGPCFENHGLFLKSASKVLTKLHPTFGSFFKKLYQRGFIQTEPKLGKGLGTLCLTFQESGLPMIFGSLGTKFKDIIVFFHEFGHAFHSYSSILQKNILLRQPGIEACEFASLGFECLILPHLKELWPHEYDFENAKKYKKQDLLHLIIQGALVDEFQEKIYQNKDSTREERNKIWHNLLREYEPYTSAENRGHSWLYKSHIFTSPFYYIDYSIGGLGALELLCDSNPSTALSKYLNFVGLGGQRSTPELFKEASLELELTDEYFKKIETLFS